MKKSFDAVEMVRAVQEQLGRKYAKNKKQFWEDLRKVGDATKKRTKGRRKRNDDS